RAARAGARDDDGEHARRRAARRGDPPRRAEVPARDRATALAGEARLGQPLARVAQHEESRAALRRDVERVERLVAEAAAGRILRRHFYHAVDFALRRVAHDARRAVLPASPTARASTPTGKPGCGEAKTRSLEISPSS